MNESILNPGGIRSDALLKTELKTMPLSECNRTYIEYNQKANHVTFQNGIGHGQYCAYDPTGRNDRSVKLIRK